MEMVFNLLAFSAAGLVTVPVSVLCVEIFAALLGPRGAPPDGAPERLDAERVAVLVPAHDEGAGLLPTLRDIQAQAGSATRVVVVADNCSDDTASVAKAAGAEVIERQEPSRRGKGYALAFGIDYLRLAPPDMVVFIDADCRLGPGALAALARLCGRTQRPVQARNLMRAPGPDPKKRIAEFAWLVANHVRPLGLQAMGLPCHLFGSGMAIPWKVLRSAQIASGDLVEDRELGLNLARDGFAPVYCSAALIESFFASNPRGALSQRRRWELGSVQMIPRAARAFVTAMARGDLKLAFLALDLMVPPIVLVALFGIGVLALAGLAFATSGSAGLLTYTGFLLFTLALALWGAWGIFARHVISLGDLLRAPLYVLDKLRIFRLSSRITWERTERD